MSQFLSGMSPRDIHAALDKHIVGQDDAKKAISIALVNRNRRRQLPAELRNEISPKNILMVGPTGVGKTEIARRVARLADSPFIKVDATKFTEVGYVGSSVESIIKDLVQLAIKTEEENRKTAMRGELIDKVNDKLVELLIESQSSTSSEMSDAARMQVKEQLLAGLLEDQEVTIEDKNAQMPNFLQAGSMEDMASNLEDLFKKIKPKADGKKTYSVKNARENLLVQEAEKKMDMEALSSDVIEKVEQNAIVFIDEIDKLCSQDVRSDGVSRQGVQRDLLPLIEGTTVNTRHGPVSTDHIFFICSGAFHSSAPSDLMPELQGRLPVRVLLKPLDSDAMFRILSEPSFSLYEQYRMLLRVDDIKLVIDEAGLRRIGDLAHQMNESIENIGARRLATMMEQLLQQIMYDSKPGLYPLTAADVDALLGHLVTSEDESRFIL